MNPDANPAPASAARSSWLVNAAKCLVAFMDGLLHLLHIEKPAANTKRRRDMVKAIRKLWVAGALGAFFTALSRNLPVDLPWPLPAFDWTHLARQLLRYGYLLWLLGYFLVSSVSVERFTTDTAKDSREILRDILFDIIQSFLALLSAYAMGFLQPGSAMADWAFYFPNGAILMICILSRTMFGADQTKGINDLRMVGMILTTVSIVTLIFGFEQYLLYSTLLFVLVLLFVMLLMYFRIRLDTEDTTAAGKT
ncbi:MAG TPA: hypothetical protein VMJ35_10335 [Dongiaceae bacterium]|nr:hypothetical protein [Dongiaceae bacterium]